MRSSESVPKPNGGCLSEAGNLVAEPDLEVSHSPSYGTSAIVRDGFESLANVSAPAIHSLPTGKSQPSPLADTLLPLTQENIVNLSLALPSQSSNRALIYLIETAIIIKFY